MVANSYRCRIGPELLEGYVVLDENINLSGRLIKHSQDRQEIQRNRNTGKEAGLHQRLQRLVLLVGHCRNNNIQVKDRTDVAVKDYRDPRYSNVKFLRDEAASRLVNFPRRAWLAEESQGLLEA